MTLETSQAASADAVYLREWRRRRRVSRRQFCAHCEDIFTPKRADAAFCSTRCRQIAHRRRKAAATLGSFPNGKTAGVSTVGNLPTVKTAPTRPAQPPWRAPEPIRPPSTGTKPEAAPRPAQGPTRAGKAVDIAALIG